MVRTTAGMALGLVAATVALAQTSPPIYQADPDVYKVMFEDENFRVIAKLEKRHSRQGPRSSLSVGHLLGYGLRA